ncbi:MAG: penicillin-binding protein 2 [Opitutales bacterium]|nr:penicillin-binding protein 2 [Opitutales bacterium]MCH8539962.1 penicillin-binding protein 2 [Opitutales bacterium]
MNPSFVSGYRYALLVLTILLCFSVIGGRLYYLHVVQADELAQIALENRRQVEVLEARRGNILDRRGNFLAVNRSYRQVGADPHILREEDREKWPALANLLGIAYPELVRLLEQRHRTVAGAFPEEIRLVRWVKLHDGVDEKKYEEIRSLGIQGVYGNRYYRRDYPNGQLASHLIGFVNREGTAVMGAEHYFDFYLRGQSGWRVSERDGRRRELVQFRSREVSAKDGFHVELSIDAVVQHMVEKELEAIAEAFNPEGVSIIVSDPRTGEILGLGNYPTFNLNEFNRVPADHLRNRAITDVLEPGSTFKIVPAAAALEENLVEPDTVFDCSITHMKFGDYRARLPQDVSRNGDLTVAEIVARSSNVGAVHFAAELGEHRLHAYAERFGFGQRTEFPFIGEVRGTLHPVNRWDGLTITRLPIGHALNATPLQIHQAMATIANDGVRMQPLIARRVLDREGETVFSFDSVSAGQVISPETARTLAIMLERAASAEGTARRADIPGYEVAGKTGTTRKIIDGRYSNRHHVASFSGFFPATQPRVAITVIVDNPRYSGVPYGGVVAAPSFRNLAEQLISYMGIHTRESEENLFARWEGGAR